VADAWSESCVLAATSADVVGYLHNRLRQPYPGSHRQRCGTETRPWIVSVLPGQRINVTLLDFTAYRGRRLPARTNRKVTPSTLSLSRWLQLRVERRSTPIRLQFNRATRQFD